MEIISLHPQLDRHLVSQAQLNSITNHPSKMQNEDKPRRADILLPQIRKCVQEFFQRAAPGKVRILGDAPTSILDPEDYLRSILPFVNEVQNSVAFCQPDAETRFLAVRILKRHSFFALDVNNHEYDYETAHEDKRPVPVYVLRLSRHVTLLRKPAQDKAIADILAEMHWGHGNDPLPLIDDYTKQVVYHSPRDFSS